MPDWAEFVRARLRLRNVRPEREAEIVEDLARQLDDAYREALANGVSELDARGAAEQHVSDWDALSQSLSASEVAKMPALTAMQNRAEERDLRERGRFSWFTDFCGDAIYALRMLRKSPGFAAVAVLTLALGIGANTAIFSMVNSVLLRPLNFRQPSRLFLVREIIPQMAETYPSFPANIRNFLTWQKECHSFEEVAIVTPTDMALTGSGEPEEIFGAVSSANLFDTLGVLPRIGRSFLPEEDRPGKDREVILTDGLWRRRFNADPGVLGKQIILDGNPYTVIGVLAASFHFPKDGQMGPLTRFGLHTEFFKPLGVDPFKFDAMGEFDFAAIARLRPGVSAEQALSELNVIQAQIAKDAKEGLDLRGELIPLESEVVGGARSALLVLLAAVGAVLLIVCVNIANLVVARMPSRLREAAIRTALGASRARLLRQTLTESFLLAACGGALGVGFAYVGLHWLLAFAPADLPRLDEVHVDARVLVFAIVISALTALLFGALPAWQIARTDPQRNLKSGESRTTESRRTRHLRHSLVGFEVALSALLLITAGLLISSLVRLLHVDAGFTTERILAADVDLPAASYAKSAQRAHFYDRVSAALAQLPGVASAGWVSKLPLTGENNVSDINVPGKKWPNNSAPLANYRAASSSYFETMHIPLRAGRFFDEHDRGHTVVVISRNATDALWPGENPIGKKCVLDWGGQEQAEVVGVAANIRTVRLDQAPMLMVYVPEWYDVSPAASFVVRTGGDPRAIESGVRQVIHDTDASVPITALRPMNDVVSESVESRRFEMFLALSFAACALFLAALGIYGVVSYSTEQRRQELGIRLALGAQFSDLRGLVLRQGMTPVIVGLIAGIGLSLLGGRLIQSLLFGVRPFDPSTVACVVLVVLAVSLPASYIPARRAASVDPLVALRHE
jgi:predicted permease